jgi:hypothetical protein
MRETARSKNPKRSNYSNEYAWRADRGNLHINYMGGVDGAELGRPVSTEHTRPLLLLLLPPPLPLLLPPPPPPPPPLLLLLPPPPLLLLKMIRH